MGEARGQDTHNQVAEENLQDLGSQTGATAKDLLQDPDQEVAQRRADQGAIGGHLGHARCKVVAVLVAVLGQPRGEQLLAARQGARGEHLGPQGVVL
jgi:hypothetical protein